MINQSLHKIALIGNYLPRKCGIATFTHDLCDALREERTDSECFVVAVNDIAEGYAYPPEVQFEIAEQDLSSYLRAADFLKFANVEVLCVQHEFGIYGGPAGSISFRYCEGLISRSSPSFTPYSRSRVRSKCALCRNSFDCPIALSL